VEHFSDPLVDCRACKKRMRADQLDDAGPCPARQGTSEHDWTPARNFNLMLKTFVGAQEDAAATAYLRAETCQSIFLDFKRVRESARQKIPFGIAQIGKAFRNEINPRNFTFRSREFEQGELEGNVFIGKVPLVGVNATSEPGFFPKHVFNASGFPDGK